MSWVLYLGFIAPMAVVPPPAGDPPRRFNHDVFKRSPLAALLATVVLGYAVVTTATALLRAARLQQ